MEIYKNIDDEGKYQVSNLGNVKRVKTGRILKPLTNKIGYNRVRLYTNEMNECYIHRLVGAAFLENPNNLPVIDHIDRNKKNNTIENLRWSSISDNCSNREKKGSILEYKYKDKIKYKVQWYPIKNTRKTKLFNTYDEAEEFRRNIKY